jgi:hypothetical protein
MALLVGYVFNDLRSEHDKFQVIEFTPTGNTLPSNI